MASNFWGPFFMVNLLFFRDYCLLPEPLKFIDSILIICIMNNRAPRVPVVLNSHDRRGCGLIGTPNPLMLGRDSVSSRRTCYERTGKTAADCGGEKRRLSFGQGVPARLPYL